MTDTSFWTTRALLGALRIWRALAIVGLILLVPAMIYAAVAPDTLFPNGGVRVNGAPITDAHRHGAWVMLLVANIYLVAGLVMLRELVALVGTVRDGDPFADANVRRLRVVGAVMAALVVFALGFGWLVPADIRAANDIARTRFDGGLFIGALTVLVLAEAFREGVRLREDAEGTI